MQQVHTYIPVHSFKGTAGCVLNLGVEGALVYMCNGVIRNAVDLQTCIAIHTV